MRKLYQIVTLLFILSSSAGFAMQVPASLFPIEDYNQSTDAWINPKHFSNFNQSLLSDSMQQSYFSNFKLHWLSPWDPAHVDAILTNKKKSVTSLIHNILVKFSNANKAPKFVNYAYNYSPHNPSWLLKLKNQIPLKQLEQLRYTPKNRAILIANTYGRALPTDSPSFYSLTLPGEGYPFDNVQMSALWAATPVYILTQTNDHAWSLILSPAIITWVKTSALALVDENFINRWRNATKKGMAAIVHTKTAIQGGEPNHFYFDSYVGSVFPISSVNGHEKLFIPVKTNSGYAQIATAIPPKDQFVHMPYPASPAHFAQIIKTLIGRPYGWGGIYFNNDCSQELKSLYTAFGIWLPRHSSRQVEVGKNANQTSAPQQERIHYLTDHGHPLMTIIYVGGHIIVFVRNIKHGKDTVPLTYQNMWGLKPSNLSWRAVIGKSVFLPLLNVFPENTALASQAAQPDFNIVFLDQPNQSQGSFDGAPLKVDPESYMAS